MFLDQTKDQANYINPTRYRARTRDPIKSNMRMHSLIDIYRDKNKYATAYTFKDKTGDNQMNRIDYFLVDQETGAYTNRAKIEELCLRKCYLTFFINI